MAHYYYNKYNALGGPWLQPSIRHTQGGSISHSSFALLYKDVTWVSSSKSWVVTNQWGSMLSGGGYISSGMVGHMTRGTELLTVTAITNSSYNDYSASTMTDFRDSTEAVPGSYSQGSLVQSNILVEDGTYPSNGVHTDGFWYVRGSLYNTAPTTPGVFTQPTGTLESGDAKVISWGTSSDAEGNLSKYVLEASINAGAWTLIAQPTSPTFLYTIPTATSIKFRVKAVDNGGLESAYRDSALLTVTKPQYYWSKYNNAVTSYYAEPGWYNEGNQNGYYIASAYKSYSFNSYTGVFTGTGGIWGTNTPPNGSVGYTPSGGTLYKYTVIGDAQVIVESKTSATQLVDVRGSLVQSNIIGEETAYPNGTKHSDGYWYIRGNRVSQSIVPPGGFTTPAQNALLSPKQAINLAFGSSSAPSISTYEVQNRYNEGTWTDVGAHTNALSRQFTVTDNKTLTKVEFRVRAKNTSNIYSDYVYSEAFTVQHNSLPTLTLNTADNQTLYENSTLNIGGTAIDADIGNVVSVKFKVNNGNARTIDAKVMDGTALSFDRTLTFKQGILYDGATSITGVLVEGVPNTVTVWSEDDQGGKSADVTRTFLVVSNRAPALLVNPIASKSNLINKDAITISGSVTDPENDNVTVSYKLNGGTTVQVYKGAPGVWTFDLLLKNLLKGDNTVVIEAVDSYGAKVTKTLKVSKAHNTVPLKKAVAMWKINSASTTTKEVLAWVQRELGDLVIDAQISMTNAGEKENFVPMELTNTAPVGEAIIEDEFDFLAPVAKENIVLKLNLSRTDTASQKAIKLISGVLE